jgi:hypothetical protein
VPFFVCLFTLNVSILVLFFSFLYDKINIILYILGVLLSISQLISYVLTTFLNPGLPLLDYELNSENSAIYKKCKDCKLLLNKELYYYHCRDCDVCIEGN